MGINRKIYVFMCVCVQNVFSVGVYVEYKVLVLGLQQKIVSV